MACLVVWAEIRNLKQERVWQGVIRSEDLFSVPGYDGNDTQRLSTRWQHLSIAVSFAVHLTCIGYLQYPLWHKSPPPPVAERTFVHLLPFLAARPAQSVEEHPDKIAAPQQPAEVPTILAEDKVPHSIETPDESKVDMTLAVLKYDDPHHELPAILRRYKGYIGFGRRDETDQYVRRTFSAATREDATTPGEIVSLDGFHAIHVNGGGYDLVDELRQRHHLENYVAYALFSAAFADELKHTLRQAALAQHGGGKIASATVILRSDVENGLQAGEMVMANGSH